MSDDYARSHPPSPEVLLAKFSAFEQLLADLIERFVDLPAESVETEMQAALQRVRKVLEFDRCSFGEISEADGGIHVICSVAAEGIEPLELQRFPAELRWYIGMIKAGKTVVINDPVRDLPAEATAERTYVERGGIHSHVGIPLRVGGRILGVIGFAAFRPVPKWPAELIGRAKMVGEVLCAALARARAHARFNHLQAALWHADRAASAGALAAALVHELNQPLMAILSNAQAALRELGRGAVDREALREALEAVVHEDKRAGAVIRGLHALLRREEMLRTSIDLGACIEEVLRLMAGQLQASGIRVSTRVEGDCLALADKIQIQQVIVNLAKNAIEAMQTRPLSDRRFSVWARAGEKKVTIAVCDSGAGVAASSLDSLFTPFYSTKEQGLGLGLSISRAIVEAHGGTIWAENNADCGATFAFTLPMPGLLEQAAGILPPVSAAEPAAEHAGIRVWVVDDDPSVCEALKRVLTTAGFAVDTFVSARQFLERPNEAEAACLLLDVHMPDISGSQLHRQLLEGGIPVPVVFLTGLMDAATGIEAMKQGAVDYLLKPVNDSLLIETVQRAAKLHEAGRLRRHEQQEVRQRFGRLTPREREVVDYVVRGWLNKEIASKLGISIRTVKQHRGQMMRKLEIQSVPELVHLCQVQVSGASRAAGPGGPG